MAPTRERLTGISSTEVPGGGGHGSLTRTREGLSTAGAQAARSMLNEFWHFQWESGALVLYLNLTNGCADVFCMSLCENFSFYKSAKKAVIDLVVTSLFAHTGKQRGSKPSNANEVHFKPGSGVGMGVG